MTKAVTSADKAQEEVREVHREIAERWRTHNRTEITETIAGIEDAKGKAPTFEARTVDGRLYLEGVGSEFVLDREGVIQLRRVLEAAFQAVS